MTRCTIVVMIDPVSDPIAGTVREEEGEVTEFVGYAHLVAAIEQHRAVAGPADAGDNGGLEHGGGAA